jgi:hypothetical protein
VKIPIHLTTASGAALLCTLLCFAFLLTAFNPARSEKVEEPNYPNMALWQNGAEAVRDLHSPTRFALPSREGFSGEFPESNVHLELSLERPHQPTKYLNNNPISRRRPDQPHLREEVPLPHDQVLIPATTKSLIVPQPEHISLFLSPELQTRVDKPLQIDLETALDQSVRVHLNILPDGTVSQALFEEPVKSIELTGAIRQLRFAPALVSTTGWLEIRFTKREEL